MTFMAALRHDLITAPWFIEGPINGEAFLLYIEKVLVPTLRHGSPARVNHMSACEEWTFHNGSLREGPLCARSGRWCPGVDSARLSGRHRNCFRAAPRQD